MIDLAIPSGADNDPRLKEPLKAVLFDMDGVITDTARAHAECWKLLFDPFLEECARRQGAPFRPFDSDRDYHEFVDGKPRHDGIVSFLASRGISLARGGEGDPPDAETVYGLGKRKNLFFQDWLASHPVPALAATVALIDRLRRAGLKVAVFSASRNAKAVLAGAGVTELFDAIVDGNDLVRLQLPGKPDPAMLLETAAQLGVTPAEAAVAEDAVAGVAAGRAGKFQLVIGMDRGHNGAALKRSGADVVVRSLAELSLTPDGLMPKTLSTLPQFRDREGEVHDILSTKDFVVFLDYDGTLTPIVEDHTKAFLGDDMQATVAALADRCKVAIVSGRDIRMLRDLVKVDGVAYAGSHGFEISGPQGLHDSLEKGVEFLPILERAEKRLRAGLAGIPGHAVERKRFSIAVHYRRATAADATLIESIVDTVLSEYSGLKKGLGKKVFELRPDIDWDKGQAVDWLLERLTGDGAMPIYVGDDITDEDAFRALAGRGLSLVVVNPEDRQTAADYALADTDEVRYFLQFLTAIAPERSC